MPVRATVVFKGGKFGRLDVLAVMVFVRDGFIAIEAMIGIDVVDSCCDVTEGAVLCFGVVAIASADVNPVGTHD